MKLYALGMGPGNLDQLTPKAKEVLENCEVIVGYTKYIELVDEFLEGKEVIQTGMKSEVERCQRAVDEAKQGKNVVVVSSGDAGIYGMACLLFEMVEKEDIEIEVIPGMTAAISAASILGSPLTNDFAVISLSDLLTPWEVIEKRLNAMAEADMVICLYNPRSMKRSDYLEKAANICLRHKPEGTYCGYVKNALREGTEYEVCTLKDLGKAEVDMFTTVIIGNSSTKLMKGRLVTTRGYSI